MRLKRRCKAVEPSSGMRCRLRLKHFGHEAKMGRGITFVWWDDSHSVVRVQDGEMRVGTW